MIKNPHIQTLIGPIITKKNRTPFHHMRLELSDGDFIDYHYHIAPASEQCVILFPGLGGSIHSHYIQRMIKALYAKSLSFVVMCYRGSSGQRNRHQGGYHFGMESDLAEVIDHVKKTFSSKRFALVGYSMGGNLLLRYLASGYSDYEKAVCVSIPFCLHATSNALNKGVSRGYQRHMLKCLKRLLRYKHQSEIKPKEVLHGLAARSFLDFDASYTAPVNGFKSRDAYYNHAAIAPVLAKIRSKVTLVQSLDDPIVPHESLPHELLAGQYPFIDTHFSPGGGHVGYWSIKGFKLHCELTQKLLGVINGCSDS